ncbi:hypothetical protein TNCT_725981 [Trichonephila clavata]|uniref:Uncharacterized protein n=1 Tax=Trichonephila clavata TaxID=2740835 RepID=A0A8X6GEC0_TRICU|nr:hypothetical protein TNCT_725981 [Trichonephila clavata]
MNWVRLVIVKSTVRENVTQARAMSEWLEKKERILQPLLSICNCNKRSIKSSSLADGNYENQLRYAMWNTKINEVKEWINKYLIN